MAPKTNSTVCLYLLLLLSLLGLATATTSAPRPDDVSTNVPSSTSVYTDPHGCPYSRGIKLHPTAKVNAALISVKKNASPYQTPLAEDPELQQFNCLMRFSSNPAYDEDETAELEQMMRHAQLNLQGQAEEQRVPPPAQVYINNPTRQGNKHGSTLGDRLAHWWEELDAFGTYAAYHPSINYPPPKTRISTTSTVAAKAGYVGVYPKEQEMDDLLPLLRYLRSIAVPQPAKDRISKLNGHLPSFVPQKGSRGSDLLSRGYRSLFDRASVADSLILKKISLVTFRSRCGSTFAIRLNSGCSTYGKIWRFLHPCGPIAFWLESLGKSVQDAPIGEQ